MKQKNGSIYPMIEDEQMEMIETFIAESVDAGLFAKKFAIWLLRKTNNLTREVAISLPNDFHGIEVQIAITQMQSDMNSTKIDRIFNLTGTSMRFSCRIGMFFAKEFNNTTEGRTIWCSDHSLKREYPIDVTFLPLPKEREINSIDL